MQRLPPPRTPQSPINIVSGLNGAIPTVWDSNWQLYTDLSSAQIAAFQAMSEWQTFVTSFQDWENSLSNIFLVGSAGAAPSLTASTAPSSTGITPLI